MAEAQNFFLAAKNFTSYAFKPQTETVQWGGVYDKATIDPRTTTTKVFYARGNRNAAAGTQGTLVYKAEDDATTTLTFTWEVPWVPARRASTSRRPATSSSTSIPSRTTRCCGRS